MIKALTSVLFLSMLSGLSYAKAPKLILQVTADGLRADLMERYENHYGKNGFNYLLREGVVYTNAHYLHANTETIVGHTTLATGATPAIHGMIGNVWYHADSGELGKDSGRLYSDEVLAIRNNIHPQRAGDIYVYQKPNWFMFDRGPIGAMHGSPYRYDTHVPLIFVGGGAKPQTVARPVHPIDVAPTLPAYLGISAPALAQGVPLAEVVQ